ncbi:transglutaminase domain-containing protein [Clostridium cylindrosporum]|uniref:Transglutaminase-like superfamily n=1 Tax=Clostridium cylindrosporum DSM 605 TaxID=1121307 RepID=A0A0J8D7Q3_CLOCY|nr:transglutaminase domain-containing protein [Clostridium cylindrosporum]KMT22065.1 transglutaminase-like superfamily [Clostridium cylindrosporum DSM 605]
MVKFFYKAIVFVAIVFGLIYFLPKFVQEELNPILLSQETKGSTTYEVSNYKEYYEAIRLSIKNLEPTINIVFKDNYLKNNRDKVISEANELIRTLGPGNYIRKYSIIHKKSNLYEFYTITYNYEKTISEIKEQSQKVDKITKNVINKITRDNMSDYEKEKVIHNYIVKHTRYDNENFQKNTTPIESHTAYGVFVNKSAVCEGYAIAMKKMLDAANIESLIVIGKADGYDHAWNLVKLDDEWYHVDPTWDDPVYTVNGKIVDILSYEYFNLTDKEMSKTHKWDKKNYPKATAKKYSIKNKKAS